MREIFHSMCDVVYSIVCVRVFHSICEEFHSMCEIFHSMCEVFHSICEGIP